MAKTTGKIIIPSSAYAFKPFSLNSSTCSRFPVILMDTSMYFEYLHPTRVNVNWPIRPFDPWPADPLPALNLYIGWQWRNFLISYLCQLFSRHVVGQALRSVSYSDIIFTARRYASAVLGVVILSVCPSVRLSVCHTRALWLIQSTYRRCFYTTWKGNF